MTCVLVKSRYGTGRVDVESWANPRTFLVDICLENGDTMPEYKEKLDYLDVEEF